MARFFIDRPIFAWVLAILLMLAGVLAIHSLPVEQYPDISPPQVTIHITDPGASAETIESTVTQKIEQYMNGLDGLVYMSSNSESSGQATLTLSFKNGTDPDIAQVQVQNKLQLASARLPQAVQQQGILVTKSHPDFLLTVGFVSDNGSMGFADLSNYVGSHLLDTISRLDGVGNIHMFGTPYALRIWLDPDKLNTYKISPSDIRSAVKAQNADVSAGQAGAMPAAMGQKLNVTVTVHSLLQTPQQFGAILLRTNPDGSSVHLRDVARIELGSDNYAEIARFNGKPAVGVAISLATGANALQTEDLVKSTIAKMSKFFPPGLRAVYMYDTAPFVSVSIHEVVKTLIEAIALVFLVMYLFLQNFRATLIPTIAVPVVLLGTFGVLAAFGYSINTLTMFGMVLAIGLLVDDAIVVVENVERVMSEEGLSPKEATKKSMAQITSALVGISLVLSAVFVPMAFFSGSTGVIYRQFAVTIVSAMVLSVLVALVLTPALCATLLKPVEKDHMHHHTGFFGWFNRVFDRNTERYQSAVSRVLARAKRFMLLYILLIIAVALLFVLVPTSFLPNEDQGVLYTTVTLPPNATQQSTINVLKKVEDHFLVDEKQNVASVFSVAGYSFSGGGDNVGMVWVVLKDWDQRQSAQQKVSAIVARATAVFSKIREAKVFAFEPPAVKSLGNATGFDLELEDQSGMGHKKLMAARNQLLAMAAKTPSLQLVRPNGLEDTPQYKLDIDPDRVGALGLTMSGVNDVLAAGWGGDYINDFINAGRTKKVYQQGDEPYRMQPEDISRWYVKNNSGDMVPFSAFSGGHWISGSPKLERYNGVSSVEILGQPAPGLSSGVAMQTMESLIAKLPPGVGYDWTGLSYQEKLAGSQATSLYALSILVVFLCLAALYESWSVPLAVILVVPLGVVGVLLATWLRGLANDVYFQVGLLIIIGLSSKNAILIVEFAKALQEQGRGLVEATLEATRLRLRPIIMTSLAFGLGVLPLAIANGAGSGSENAIGTGVLGGVFTATFLGVFLVPLFFVQVRKFFAKKNQPTTPTVEKEVE